MNTVYTFIEGSASTGSTIFQKKTCIHCKQEKSVTQFPKNGTGYDSRCTECRDQRGREVKKLRNSPTTPEMPEYCECCGKQNPKKNNVQSNIPGKLASTLNLDHYYDEKGAPFFRGWICKQCNSGIGYLGDNVIGVYKAFCYLMKTLPEAQRQDTLKEMSDLYPEYAKMLLLKEEHG